MVHAIEAYTSRHKKNPMSDQLARQASDAAVGQHPRGLPQRRATSRRAREMLLGSMLAGMAFANAPVAAVHALAYPIGAIFHVPHGLSNALVLMGVLRFNLPAGGGALRRACARSSIPARATCRRRRPRGASSTRSPRSAAIAACRRRLRRSASARSDLERLADRRDEADAASREQPARGHLRGRLRDLQRGAGRQAAAGGLSDGEVAR